MVKDQTGSYIFSTSNRPRPISFLPPSPPNRGHLSASTPSPSGLAPVYKSVAAASFYRYRYRFTAHIIFSMRGVRGNAREFSGAVQNVHRVFRVFMTRYGGGCRPHTPAMPLRGASLPPSVFGVMRGVGGNAREFLGCCSKCSPSVQSVHDARTVRNVTGVRCDMAAISNNKRRDDLLADGNVRCGPRCVELRGPEHLSSMSNN